MHYEADQSGKIEQTEKDTIVAVVNCNSVSVIISKGDKRKLEKVFRSHGVLKVYRYYTFSALLAFALNYLKPGRKVIIDREYLGYEGLILERVNYYLKKMKNDSKYHLEFGFVGKKSPAHKLAYGVGTKRKKPDIAIRYSEVTKLIFK